MFTSIFKRSPTLHLKLCFRCLSTIQKEPWQPWEDELLRNYVKVNGNKWTDIVQHCLPNRTQKQCQARWSDVLNPDIHRGPFSMEERELLEKGVKSFGEGRWRAIKDNLLPHRSCRRIANEWSNRNNAKHPEWTKEEDALVLAGVERFGKQAWQKISSELLPGRSRSQIYTRYTSYLDPDVKRTRWTSNELDLLLRRTIRYGQDWKKVAEGIPGRTALQCSSMWTVHLDPALNKGAWPEPETRLFWEKLVDCNGHFSKLDLPGRNTVSYSNKFYDILRYDEQFTVMYGDQIERKKSENAPEWRTRIAKLVCEYLGLDITIREAPNKSIYLHKRGSWRTDELERLQKLTEGMDVIDWKKIAEHIEGRNAQQCKYQYEQRILTKDVKKGPWTEEEDELLLSQVEKYGTKWSMIQVPHRSQIQCQYRWNRVLKFDPKDRSSRLSEDEISLINEGVQMFGRNWTAIQMTYLPHRTPQMIMRWWNRHLSGLPWTEDQDKALTFAVSKYKDDWERIAKLVDGKLPEQCKSRWLYSLDPSLKKGRWDYDEQMQLYEIALKHRLTAIPGKSIWPQVAKELGTGRSEWACRLKFNSMQRKEGSRFGF